MFACVPFCEPLGPNRGEFRSIERENRVVETFQKRRLPFQRGRILYPLRENLPLELRFKTIVPHITHKCIDKKRLASVPLTKFLEKKRQYCFSQKVHEKLRESGINEQNFNLNQSTVLIVRNELDLFYRFLISD